MVIILKKFEVSSTGRLFFDIFDDDDDDDDDDDSKRCGPRGPSYCSSYKSPTA
jgi:hypothetical protein